MLLLIAAASWLYIYFRAIRNLKLAPVWHILLSILAAIFSLKFQLLKLFGGGMFTAQELPLWVLYLTAIAYGVYFLFFMLIIPADLIFSLTHFIADKKSGKKSSWLKARRIFTAALLLSSLVLALIGFFNFLNAPQITPYHITLDNYRGRELQIALLSDLHVDPATPAGVIDEIVAQTNALSPDLIVIVGDFADGKLENRRSELEKLGKLHATFGVFGVSGNHEFYLDYFGFLEFMQSIGITMLENQHVVIDGNLVLAGVSDDAGSGKKYRIKPDIDQALAGTDPALPVILLAHRPKTFDENQNHCQLQLSGHTHGGMILGMNMMVALLNGYYVSGLYDCGNSKLIVSNGTRLWGGFPFRLGMPSEIALITISGK